MQRRSFLSLSILFTASSLFSLAAARLAHSEGVDTNAVLQDLDAPIGGNPKGDVTIVAFLDYNCPFCKKSAPDLDRIVRDDGKIRLVYKDWPILAPSSVFGARAALAAKYQDRYEAAHHALMAIPGHGIAEDKMLAAIRAAGIDMERLNRDLTAHAAEIDALLRRNLAQADALGLQGTPTYLIGPFMTSTLDYAGFQQVVADARAHAAKP